MYKAIMLTRMAFLLETRAENHSLPVGEAVMILIFYVCKWENISDITCAIQGALSHVVWVAATFDIVELILWTLH